MFATALSCYRRALFISLTELPNHPSGGMAVNP